jgi:hypothetical protein
MFSSSNIRFKGLKAYDFGVAVATMIAPMAAGIMVLAISISFGRTGAALK